MDRQKNKGKIIDKNTEKTFILIHGYTGSITDFNNLPEILSKKFNAKVIIPLLHGHKSKIENLDNFKLEDYLNQIEAIIKEEILKGNKIVLGGYSFGSLLALYFASKYDVEAVFSINVPYKMRFFLTSKLFIKLAKSRKKWKKPLTKKELALREFAFFYLYVPGNTLELIKKTNDLLTPELSKIKCPVMIVNTQFDPWIPYSSIKNLLYNIKSKHKGFAIIKCNHDSFYSPKKDEVCKIILDFCKKSKIFKKKKDEEIDAIVCAYNEAPRIKNIIKDLLKAKNLNKIIIIDDGSKDNTKEIIEGFKSDKIVYIKNKKNMGKAQSMNKAVKFSKASILFFCDADIIDMKEEIINSIILPVKKGKVDMYVGMCGDWNQSWWSLVSRNSGQRAIRREIWEKLPKFYKHRYRIEYGMNKITEKVRRKIEFKKFDYSQSIKEKKYGFLKGMFLRLGLYLDVVVAICRFNLYDRFRKIDF